MAPYEVTEANLALAVDFIAGHPRCSIIDLEPVLRLGPAQVWPVIHELENRRLVRVQSGPAGFRFEVENGADEPSRADRTPRRP